MKRKQQTVILILLAAAVVAAGLFSPALIEALASRSTAGVQTRQTEVISFDGDAGSVIEILNRMSRAAETEYPEDDARKGDALLESYNLEQGYRYTAKTAETHARELLSEFLLACGFENAEAYFSETFQNGSYSPCLLVAAEYPTPWSAIIWIATMEYADGIAVSLMFDDASGTLLGINVPLLGEDIPWESVWEMDEVFDGNGSYAPQDAENQPLIEQLNNRCCAQFASMLDAKISAGYDVMVDVYDMYGDVLFGFTVATEYNEQASLRAVWRDNGEGFVSLTISAIEM